MTLCLKPVVSKLILAMGFIIFSTSAGLSQDKQTMSDIEIYIKYDDESVTMECKSGCEWQNLGFSLGSGNEEQYVNQLGMVAADDLDREYQGSLTPFHFMISRNTVEGGLLLSNSHGTAWTELSFKSMGADSWSTLNAKGITLDTGKM